MKKIFSLLLVATMVLSLCACGNNNDSDSVDYTNSNQISNDTTVVIPDTTDSSAIEYNPTPVEPEVPFDLSVNNKESDVIPEYEKLDLGYKMCSLGIKELTDCYLHFYWVELTDSWKYIYDTYGTMFVEVVDAKDNCKIDSYYKNIRQSSDKTIIYDEFSRDRNVNRDGFILRVMEQKDGHFEKNKYNNYAKIEDLGFILYDYGFKKGQVLEVNCEKEDLNLNWSIYDTNGLIFVGDDNYIIKDIKLTDANELKDLIVSVEIDLLFSENGLDELVLGGFNFYDEKTMEKGIYPEGTTFVSDVETIYTTEDISNRVKLKFTVSNPNGFSDEFIELYRNCIFEFDLNGQNYCVDTY
jgi:hypothetical protein